MSDRRAPGRQSPPRRIFVAFLLVSVAAHATALVALSPLARESGPSRTRALEVVILSPKPLLLETRKPAAVPRAATRSESIPKQAAASNAPRTLVREPIIALRELDPHERHAVPAPSELPRPSTSEASEHKREQATAPATVPRFNATYLSNAAPRYPDAARRSGEQGTVTLRVHVARDGAASRVAVEKSSGSPHLDAAALEAVKAWRFAPARRGAEAIESWILVPIVFRLENPS